MTTQAGLTLKGRIDRVDAKPEPDGSVSLFLFDYKTEDQSITKARLKQPLEDTQLLFYALLPGSHSHQVRAAYLNVGTVSAKADGKNNPITFEHLQLSEHAQILWQALQHDSEQIAKGAALKALGAVSNIKACRYCEVRGLCRRDEWCL